MLTDSHNIYYQYVDCGPIEYINFKAENTSNQTKNVTWTYDFVNNLTSLSQNPDDANVSFILNASEVRNGECILGQNQDLQIYVKEGTLPLRLTLIKLLNLTVSN